MTRRTSVRQTTTCAPGVTPKTVQILEIGRNPRKCGGFSRAPASDTGYRSAICNCGGSSGRSRTCGWGKSQRPPGSYAERSCGRTAGMLPVPFT
jgi:hypothetical protein